MFSPHTYKNIEEIVLQTNNKEEFVITQVIFDQIINFKPDNDYKFSFHIPFNPVNDFIIKDDFVICYINLGVLSEIGVQSTYASIIKKENFIYV
jgi:hypothetical protein